MPQEYVSQVHEHLSESEPSMSMYKNGAFNKDDFEQLAEIKMIELERSGKKFSSLEHKRRYRDKIAKNLSLDQARITANRIRILKEEYKPEDHSERAIEIAAAQQLVADALARMKANNPSITKNNKLTARAIGTNMAVELIEWELQGVTHAQIACKVFNVEKSTPALTHKICNATKVAKTIFKEACLARSF